MPKLKISAFLLAITGVAIPAGAHAHFVLQAPMNWAKQDSQGLPEKSAPCGQADPLTAAVATNVVTPYAPGDTVTITIMETTPHPGHYRVVLSPTGMSGLPADPTVTAAGTDPCGSTTIQNPPVYPVLADGMLQHTGVMSGARSFTVTLPTNVTCTKCSLQVEEFMSSHPLNNPGGCWYHHCADISIQPGGGGAGGRGGAGGAGGAAGGRGGAGGMSGRGGAGGAAGRGGAGGSAGTSGSAGASGTAGGSGTTGTAGGSGASGTAGTTGTAGASATAGSSGATGVGGAGGTSAVGSGGSGGNAATGRGGTGATGTAGSGVDAGPPGGGDSGGGCAIGEKNISLSALILVLVAFVIRRRPRRR